METQHWKMETQHWTMENIHRALENIHWTMEKSHQKWKQILDDGKLSLDYEKSTWKKNGKWKTNIQQ